MMKVSKHEILHFVQDDKEGMRSFGLRPQDDKGTDHVILSVAKNLKNTRSFTSFRMTKEKNNVILSVAKNLIKPHTFLLIYLTIFHTTLYLYQEDFLLIGRLYLLFLIDL